MRAQDNPTVGLVAGFPASIGVIWHATDKIAVRPDFTFSTGSGETKSTTTGPVPLPPPLSDVVTETDSSSFTTGVSALFYIVRADALRMYVSPRYAYSRSTTDSERTPSFGIDTEATGSGHFIAGSFGAQQGIGQRFGVFGEVGLSWARSTSSTGTTGLAVETTATSFGLRGGVGVIVYF